MIITAEKLSTLIDIQDFSEAKLNMILEGIEMLVRKLTNNHFHNKNVRFNLTVLNGQLKGEFHHLSVGDTIEVSESEYNQNHVANITLIEGDVITLSKPLLDEDNPVQITKIVYPADIIQGVVNLIDWEINNREKMGIKSESISRHSVTYYDADSNHVHGYPASLMDFIKPYCKARF